MTAQDIKENNLTIFTHEADDDSAHQILQEDLYDTEHEEALADLHADRMIKEMFNHK